MMKLSDFSAFLAFTLIFLFCVEIALGNDPYFRDDCIFMEYNSSEVIQYTVSSEAGANASSYRVGDQKLADIKDEVEQRLDMANINLIREVAAPLVACAPGSLNIGQICAIYNYMRNNWSYVDDPRGLEYFQNANWTMELGRRSHPVRSGVGDCDDFSILMSSFIESIGGATMIVMAEDPAGRGGHVFTEVYLGKLGQDDGNIKRTMEWLRKAYKKTDIKYDIPKPQTGEVWLNLDWNTTYPGGSPERKAKNIPIILRSDVIKPAMGPANEPPVAIISYSYQPKIPYARDPITFDANNSFDIDKNIESYEWDFGDESPRDNSISTNHYYSKSGTYKVTLAVKDNKGAVGLNSTAITLKEPPLASFSWSPDDPKPGDKITFWAMKKDGEDVSNYQWNFGDGSGGKRSIEHHEYPDKGIYAVTLTVEDANGGRNSTFAQVAVGKPIINMFAIGGGIGGSSEVFTEESFGLMWNISNVEKATIDHGIGEVGPSGGTMVSTKESTAYTLKAENEVGSVERTIYVSRNDEKPIINSFYADPEKIKVGEGTTLYWNTSYSGSVMISSIGNADKNGPSGYVGGSSGSISVYPTKNTKYSLACFSNVFSERVISRNVSVWVEQINPVINGFSANPQTINISESTWLSWGVSGATTVVIEPEVGKVPSNGHITIAPSETTVYKLTATSDDGSSEATVRVNVRSNDATPVAAINPKVAINPKIMLLNRSNTKKMLNASMPLIKLKLAKP